ncbi:MAG TPA: NAD+ synthase, partial [Beijerinckiaceae bacterium]|nr:NAD+ synthase [Beijerinckiaceae bacterium]
DSLPPYDVLDDILECLVEREMRVCEVVARGHDLETVKKIERLLYLAEYKRRQAAPGVKVTRKNFGRDRRYPIVNRFRDQGKVAFKADEALQQGAGEGVGVVVDL